MPCVPAGCGRSGRATSTRGSASSGSVRACPTVCRNVWPADEVGRAALVASGGAGDLELAYFADRSAATPLEVVPYRLTVSPPKLSVHNLMPH